MALPLIVNNAISIAEATFQELQMATAEATAKSGRNWGHVGTLSEARKHAVQLVVSLAHATDCIVNLPDQIGGITRNDAIGGI